MMGPLEIKVLTTRVASTVTKTEQNARQKWHFLLCMSIQECLINSLDDPRHESEPSLFSISSSGSWMLLFWVLANVLSLYTPKPLGELPLGGLARAEREE